MIEPLETVKGRVAATSRLRVDWTNAESWPSDTPHNVFLGEAIQSIGTARFGANWRLSDSYAVALDPLPKVIEHATTPQVTRAGRYLGIELVSWLLAPDRKTTPPPITAEQWAKAVVLDEEATDRAAKAVLRWKWVVVIYLEAKLRDGTLASFTRFKNGVDFHKCEQKLWFVDQPFERFRTCAMDPDQPFNHSSSKKRWIFLDRAEVQAAVHAITAEQAPATSLRHKAEFKELLLGKVRASERNPHNRDHWQELARAEFDLPRDAFDEIWSQVMLLVPGTKWNAPGRRPKKTL